MGKRPLREEHNQNNNFNETPKRQRIERPVETFHNAKQLQQALTFHQDSVNDFSNGIKSFKPFLESIVYAEEKASTGRQQNILKDYLDSQPATKSFEDDDPFLSSFIQAWSYASQMNNERLVSSVSANLALLIKTLSTLIDLRDHGIRLCRLLLQQSQLKLLSQSLSAPKQKEHIISPSLRILTEIVSFDGGTLADRVYTAKQSVLEPRSLIRNLSLRKEEEEDDSSTGIKRPSVRDNAVRYLLASLRFHSASNVSELLRNGPIFRSLFENLKTDSSSLAIDVLTTFRTHVVDDLKVSRASVGYTLADQNLLHIATLLRSDATEDPDHPKGRPSEVANRFLSYVCTNPDAGIIRSSTGWYPVGSDVDQDVVEYNGSDLSGGIDSVEWFEKYHERVPIRNLHLAKFVSGLRPHSNSSEMKLCVEIFRAVPELVASYYLQKTGFLFDPKLTATWIGLASILFSTISLPVPSAFGLRNGFSNIPPPTSVVMENILPQPLSQKILLRCLNQKEELITFFSLRILVVAFQKLQKCLEMYREAEQESGQLWVEGREQLAKSFSKRVPQIKDLIAVGQKLGDERHLEKEALYRLLRLYSNVTPHLAIEAKLDVSTMLVDALVAQDEIHQNSVQDHSKVSSGLTILNAGHLLQVARWSSDTIWWSKSGKLTHSPLGSLIKMIVAQRHSPTSSDTNDLIHHIFADNGILQTTTEPTGSRAFVESVRYLTLDHVSDNFLETLDDLCQRLTRRMIKYEDDLDEFKRSDTDSPPVSMLWLVLAEQWSFISARSEAHAFAEWIAAFAASCFLIGEDDEVIAKIIADMSSISHADEFRLAYSASLKARLQSALDGSTTQQAGTSDEDEQPAGQTFTVSSSTFTPPSESIYHPSLHTALSNLPDQLSSPSFPHLFLNLSSTDIDIRTLALRHLLTLRNTLSASTHTDAKQFYLLAGILYNTCTSPPIDISKSPAPWTLTVYAASAWRILNDPLHVMYDKIARFHTKAPKFDVHRLVAYWTGKVLREVPSSFHAPYVESSSHASSRRDATSHLSTPHSTSHSNLSSTNNPTNSEDETSHITLSRPYGSNDHLNELHFLLHYIYSILQSPVDLEILRAKGTLEPIMNLVNDVYIPEKLKEVVIMILWRVVAIDGGAGMLITRRGVVAWIEMLCRSQSEKGTLRKGRRGVVNTGTMAGIGKSRDKDGPEEQERARLLSPSNLKALLGEIWEKCDHERMMEWSCGRIEGDIRRVLEK